MSTRWTYALVSVGLLLAPPISGGNNPPESAGHWSLRPITRPAPPQSTDASNASWCKTPIDQFILQKLESEGMRPSPPAAKETLLRRVYFDLLGLPPTPAELEAFRNDPSSNSFERVVDHLLARPEYGERWARHWLDVAHYAETHGHDQDRPRTNAWPYRDYVIASFNTDKPYARFVQEQIAGDVLFPNDPNAVVAMGFLATGPWDESSLRDIREDSIDRQIARYIDRDDIVSTVMNTFVSTTVQCARCHDHKFDPVTQGEYYRLQAVFAGTDKANRYYDLDPKIHRERTLVLARKREIELRSPALTNQWIAGDIPETAAWELSPILPADIALILLTPAPLRLDAQKVALGSFVAEHQVEHDLKLLPEPRQVYAGASDFVPDGSLKPVAKPREVRLLKRGDIHKPGEIALSGALDCVRELNGEFALGTESPEGERRAALARWIADPHNALTWRSIVNRVWHSHFGRGLVSTPNDFGNTGAAPSHPELLDWLAGWFLENGGSFKKLHKLVLSSAVYQQSSTGHPEYAARDADNLLLWRMSPTRLDAESVRDTILAVTATLDARMGGPSVQQFVMSPGIHVTPKVDYTAFDVDRPESRRRGVYRFVFRTLPDPFMESLDCPDGSQLTPARNASVTVAQALALLNDQFVVRYSEHFADRLERQFPGGLDLQIREAIALAFSREARTEETTELSGFAREFGLANLCRVLFNSNEFIFVQ